MTAATSRASLWSRGPKYFLVLGLWVVGLVTAMMVLTFIDKRVVDAPVYVCPPDCGHPPSGLPVSPNPRFVAPDGAFSVSFPSPGPAYTVTTYDNGVSSQWVVGDGGTLRLFGIPAQGRDARAVVDKYLADTFPEAAVAYELPNATAGYEPGYGVVADFQSQKRTDSVRVIVISAVKSDLALVAVAQGPFRQFTPEFGPGPPSPANLQIAEEMGKYLDSFSWRGDPPR